MSLVVASFLFASSRCPWPCPFCGVLRFAALPLLRLFRGSLPCPLWKFLLPAPCLFLRPFSGAFHVGGPSLFSRLRELPGTEKRRCGGLSEALQRGSGALPLLPFVACSLLGCPVAFVPLERSCRSGKKEVALPLLPFAVRLPLSRWNGRQDGRGRYCLFATFSSSPSPSPVPPFREPPEAEKGLCSGFVVQPDTVCCRQRALSVLGRGALSEQFAAILTRHPAGLEKETVAASGVRKRFRCSPSPPPLLLRPPGEPPRGGKGCCSGFAVRSDSVCCR